jgi:hypothetical protein
MNGAGSQLVAAPVGALPKGRTALSHLLHALNQPLTGLQCSLELATSGIRPAEQYVRTLREGLELTARMRILVAAVRELADLEQFVAEAGEPWLFDTLLRDGVADLLPVAETRRVRLLPANQTHLPVQADRGHLSRLLFRLLESVLSLAIEGSEVQMVTVRARERGSLAVSWTPGAPPEHSPFSAPELGLLLAQAGWERAGGEWSYSRGETTPDCPISICTIRMSLASPQAMPWPGGAGELR